MYSSWNKKRIGDLCEKKFKKLLTLNLTTYKYIIMFKEFNKFILIAFNLTNVLGSENLEGLTCKQGNISCNNSFQQGGASSKPNTSMLLAFILGTQESKRSRVRK